MTWPRPPTTGTVVSAVDQALSTRLVRDKPSPPSWSAARPGAGGACDPSVRSWLAGGSSGRPRASVLERRGPPPARPLGHSRSPVHEVKAGPDDRYRLDFMLLPPVAMEVDGYTHHWSPEAKAHDEARRNRLRLDGLFLLVYTWIDVRR